MSYYYSSPSVEEDRWEQRVNARRASNVGDWLEANGDLFLRIADALDAVAKCHATTPPGDISGYIEKTPSLISAVRNKGDRYTDDQRLAAAFELKRTTLLIKKHAELIFEHHDEKKRFFEFTNRSDAVLKRFFFPTPDVAK